MKVRNFFPALLSVGVMLWAVCLSAGAALSEPEAGSKAPEILQPQSREDWNRSLIRKGHTSERLGQKQDALADYTLAIESRALTGADQVQVLFDRGLLLDGMGRLRDALADYSVALSLSPNFVAALNNRAGIYTRLGQFADARRDYLSALAAGSSEPQYSYFGLGEVAETQGSFTEAKDFYNRALALDPLFRLAEERLAVLAVLASGRGGAQPPRTAATATPIDSANDRGARQPAPLSAGLDVLSKGSGPGSDVQVQLGAWRSEQNASKGWDQARTLAGDILKRASPRIVAVDLPGAGRFYRLRIAVEQMGSRSFCAALAAKGQDCIPVRER